MGGFGAAAGGCGVGVGGCFVNETYQQQILVAASKPFDNDAEPDRAAITAHLDRTGPDASLHLFRFVYRQSQLGAHHGCGHRQQVEAGIAGNNV